MDELLTEEQKQLRAAAAKLCGARGGAKRARSLRDRRAAIDREAWRDMRKAGWLATLVPEEEDGLGLGAAELYVLLEQIGRHTNMVPMLEAASAAWLLGRAHGAGSVPALRAALAGERMILPALHADGWDFRRKTQAVQGRAARNAVILDGRVPAVPFATVADDFLLRAEAEEETLLCLVARTDRGCKVEPHAHVDGSIAGDVILSGVAVEEMHILASASDATALCDRLAELLALGAAIELLGLAETALALTLDHIKMRKQFGHPLGSFQALQHRVVDGFVDLELDRSLLHRLSLAWDEGTSHPAMIAAAKSRASKSAAEIMRGALQLHGAIGYTDAHDIGILFKRALVRAAQYGNELTQAERFARLTAAEA